jgi:hypothetical protein
MTMTKREFNSDEFRLTDGALKEWRIKRPARSKKDGFIKVPLAWIRLLDGSRHCATFKVLAYLLEQEFKQAVKGQSIPVSNVALTERGVSRFEKWEALRELEAFGICAVERRLRRNPLALLLRPC